MDLTSPWVPLTQKPPNQFKNRHDKLFTQEGILQISHRFPTLAIVATRVNIKPCLHCQRVRSASLLLMEGRGWGGWVGVTNFDELLQVKTDMQSEPFKILAVHVVIQTRYISRPCSDEARTSHHRQSKLRIHHTAHVYVHDHQKSVFFLMHISTLV